MKKVLHTIISFTFLVSTNTIVGQELEWARSFGGSSQEQGKSILTDNSGNLYTYGFFKGTIDFDPGPGIYSLTSEGGNDLFIQKLDAFGNFVWAKTFGGVSNDVPGSIAIDNQENLYFSGGFQGTVDFDPGATTYNLTSAGNTDAFVLKLDTSGNFIWVKSIGGTDSDYGNSLTIDELGSIYISGSFKGTADFDPGAGTNNLISAGGSDVFLLKLNASGNFVWAKSYGGTFNDGLGEVKLDNFGHLYTVGQFENTVDFDPGAATFNLTSMEDTDAFIQKMDTSGNFIWAKSFMGSSFVYGRALDIDNSGNIYTIGDFYETIDLDPNMGVVDHTATGQYDIFVQKMDSNGNFLWSKSYGGNNLDHSRSICLDQNGNVYVAGFFRETVDFDPGVNTFNVTSAGETDIFIQKLDASGNFLWVETIGGSNENGDLANSVKVDNDGNIYATGFFSGTVDFNTEIGVENHTSVGLIDVFALKLSQCVPTFGTDTQTACGSFTWIDNNVYSTSNNTATYTFINGAVNGCDSTVTLNLTLNPLPTVSISAFSNDTICENSGVVSLPVGSPSGGIYTGTGVTGGNFDPQISGTGTFNIVYTYTNGSNCSDSDSTQITVVGCLGINQEGTDIFTVAPNPFTSNLQVSNLKNGSYVSLLDMKGKLVFEQTSNTTSLTINSENLECGVYFVRISSSAGIFHEKIIKN